MDQTSHRRNCQKHPNNSLEFIQVKQINQSTDKSIFYCSVCINEDLSFKGLDYLLINQIEQQGDQSIIQKWPPINDPQILDQLIQIAANVQSHSKVEHSITNFFSMLKQEISNRIDTCQKKMINLVKDQPIDGESIIRRYQAISQICEFRNMLLRGNSTDLYEQESTYKNFIMQVEEKRDVNTEKLSELLNQSQKKQSLINFEFPNQIKQSILTFIDQINFFEPERINFQSNNSNHQSHHLEEQNITQRLMKLISNKSNFCSDQFLNEVRTNLSKLEPLLKSISPENQFVGNKFQINFDELTNEQLNQINHQVDHLVQLKKDEEYSRKLKNSDSIKQLNKILKNKTNFLNNNFVDKFEEYLLETYPYLTYFDSERMIEQNDKLNIIHELSSDMVDNLLKLSEKMIQLNGQDNNQSQNLITKIKPIICSYFLTTQQNEIDALLKNYPIFDLLKQPDFKELMPSIQLEKGKFNGGDQNLIINMQNNEIEVQNKESKPNNCISNITLANDKKYIFRFQIQNLDTTQKFFMIGLMKAQDIDIKCGHENKLSCCFQLKQNSNDIGLYSEDYGMKKYLKGEGFMMNCNNGDWIEFRVCIQEQLLEILDYPNYKYKIGISDQYKANLVNNKDFKLFIYLEQKQLKVILKSVQILEQFNN